MRILIVEDEIKTRTGLAALIRNRTDYMVVGEAHNGREGLALLHTLKPDLVITDIKMPEMNGLQMLEELKSAGIRQHAIILSGYSDFEYAQKALRIGADDYLIKPLTIQDVVSLLDKMNKIIEQENNEWLNGMSQVIRQAIMQRGGAIYLPQALSEQIFGENRISYAFMGHADTARIIDKEVLTRKIDKMCEKGKSLKGFAFYYEDQREIGCLLTGENSEKEMLEIFKQGMQTDAAIAKIWSAEVIQSVEDFKTAYEKMRSLLLYGMVLDTNNVITSEVAKCYKGKKFEYPQQLVRRLCKFIFGNDMECLKEKFGAFTQFVRAEKYHPECIKKGYLTLCMQILNTIQEIDTHLYDKIQSLDFLGRMEYSFTLDELEGLLNELLSYLGTSQKRSDIRNYIIMKAMNYIRENYHNGITLEEVAQFLNITPEYLSTLFNRVTGTNFSVFIRDFRLSYAKRLLKSTELKVYEIAEQVGYTDVKYFNRVFKEQMGISPKEYRMKK